jgi:hypothetical protein
MGGTPATGFGVVTPMPAQPSLAPPAAADLPGGAAALAQPPSRPQASTMQTAELPAHPMSAVVLDTHAPHAVQMPVATPALAPIPELPEGGLQGGETAQGSSPDLQQLVERDMVLATPPNLNLGGSTGAAAPGGQSDGGTPGKRARAGSGAQLCEDAGGDSPPGVRGVSQAVQHAQEMRVAGASQPGFTQERHTRVTQRGPHASAGAAGSEGCEAGAEAHDGGGAECVRSFAAWQAGSQREACMHDGARELAAAEQAVPAHAGSVQSHQGGSSGERGGTQIGVSASLGSGKPSGFSAQLARIARLAHAMQTDQQAHASGAQMATAGVQKVSMRGAASEALRDDEAWQSDGNGEFAADDEECPATPPDDRPDTFFG